MKSPAEIAVRLARQWQRADVRLARLTDPHSWPVVISIGKPKGQDIVHRAARVDAHRKAWQAVTAGEVEWAEINYRGVAEPVVMPVRWRLRSPSQWIAATDDKGVQAEFTALAEVIAGVAEIYRELLIRELALWRHKPLDEVIAACHLADGLTPGCAQGQPLRLLAGMGVDTKFCERHARLLTRLLDERYGGEASEQGLVNFLGAQDENDHWLLVIPLDKSLLPFQRLRLTSRELAQAQLAGTHLLVVENERCEHLLPELPGTLAILGAGLDLNWLANPAFADKSVGYWGDLDTWGLLMLARARQYFNRLTPLMMEYEYFKKHWQGNAVAEPAIAQDHPPEGLNAQESTLYLYLRDQAQGRLEQEYLPIQTVHTCLANWLICTKIQTGVR